MVTQAEQHQEELLEPPVLQMATQQSFDLERWQTITSSVLLPSLVPRSAAKTWREAFRAFAEDALWPLTHVLSPDEKGSRSDP